MKYRLITIAGLTSCAISATALADQMHYRNIITGERAQGLGGAYTGVSDDASGVYYNPAGLAFAQSNDISGSANAFYNKTITYKDVLGTDDWKEESSGTLAPFFGVMQKLDKYLPGLVGGFAYYMTDTELKDQDDLIVNKHGLTRFHRAANQRAASYVAAGALGYRVSPNLGLGLGLGYSKADELTQISQYRLDAGYLLMSTRESLVTHGAQVSFGVQWAPTAKVALGFTAKSGSYASQKYNQSTDVLSVSNGTVSSGPIQSQSSNPMGSMPMELRAGLAWFASPRFMLTSDIDWHDKATDMDSNMKGLYKRDSVLNYAVGGEYYVTPSVPIRLGYFTNNDATPTPTSSNSNNADHIDYKGLTIFGAIAQPTSQLSAGAVIQKGTGKARKILGKTVVQDIDALAYTLAFSATHSF